MNIFKQFYYSLYSYKFIGAVRFQKFWKTFRYILLLTFITTIPYLLVVFQIFGTNIDSLVTNIKNEAPPFSITNGTLHMEEKQSYQVHNNRIFFSIDGTDEVSATALTDYTFAVVLKQNEMWIGNGSAVDKVSYSTFSSVDINSGTLNMYLDTAKTMLPLFVVLWIVIFFIMQLFTKFVDILILAAIALITTSSMQKRGTYIHFMTIAAYSVTISTVFYTIMNFFNISVVGGFYINWIVNILVMITAVKSIPSPKKNK